MAPRSGFRPRGTPSAPCGRFPRPQEPASVAVTTACTGPRPGAHLRRSRRWAPLLVASGEHPVGWEGKGGGSGGLALAAPIALSSGHNRFFIPARRAASTKGENQ